MFKVTKLTADNIAAIRKVFPASDVKLTKTTATFTGGNPVKALEDIILRIPGRQYPKPSLHAVLRKLRKVVADAPTTPVKETPVKAVRKARKAVAAKPVIVEIHENLREMVTDAPNEKARESWERVLTAKYGVESVRAAFGYTENFTGK